MTTHSYGAVVIAVVVGIVSTAGQTPPIAKFEVASIKINKSGDRASHGLVQPGGRFVYTNVTLLQLIQSAYRVPFARLVGGPGWIRSEHYDVIAKGQDNATANQRGAMFENLVADRFAVKIHHETRELSAANLVMARADGRLGPRLTRAADADSDCNSRALPDPSKQGFARLPPCSTESRTEPNGTQQFSVPGHTMDELATELVGFHIAPIAFNETNLEGTFNIDGLEFRSDTLNSDLSVDAPSIYTAFQEQLGLRIEMIKGPADVIVIDHAEHPTPD